MKRRYERVAMTEGGVARQFDKVRDAVEGDEEAERALQILHDYVWSTHDQRIERAEESARLHELLRIDIEDMGPEDLREALERHHRCPVRPIRAFCEALWSWADAVKAGVRRAEEEGRDWQHGQDYADHLNSIFTDIEKSGLLARLIYEEEGLRTEMCPEHEGHMDTGMWVGVGDPCPHGCGGTGWLPENEDGP